MNLLKKNLAVIAIGILASIFCFYVPSTSWAGGDEIYKARCAMCHGPDGSGNTTMGKTLKVQDLKVPEVQRQTDDQLIGMITNGKAKMPAYKDKLKPEEITQVVATIRAKAKK